MALSRINIIFNGNEKSTITLNVSRAEAIRGHTL